MFRKMKKILLIQDKNSPQGSPSNQRLSAFQKYFEKRGFEVDFFPRPRSIDAALRFIYFVYKKKYDYVFNSMPMFRAFWITFLPKIKVITDIRDGWAIAIRNGYGGKVKEKPLRSFWVKVIERSLIKYSYLTITCTNGLKEYFDSFLINKVLLITNGSQFEQQLIVKRNSQKASNIFVCAGKFSEYGRGKAKKIIDTIQNRYGDKPYEIKLIGSDFLENEWAINYVKALSTDMSNLYITKRMSGSELMVEIANSDYGVCVLRDPTYEFGTKVFDYIFFNLPIVSYFDTPNNFTKYFNEHLDHKLDASIGDRVEVNRSKIIEESMLNRYL